MVIAIPTDMIKNPVFRLVQLKGAGDRRGPPDRASPERCPRSGDLPCSAATPQPRLHPHENSCRDFVGSTQPVDVSVYEQDARRWVLRLNELYRE